MTIQYPDFSQYDWDRYGANLDWVKLSTFKIAVIRASYGDPLIYSPETRHFSDMATQAKRNNIFTGGYHNLIHGDKYSISRQVAYFKSELDKVNADWAMLDVEPYPALRVNNLWPRYEDALAFAELWSEVDGRPLAIYLAKWVWSGWLGSPDLRPLATLAGGPLINADYSGYSDNGAGWRSYGNVTPEVWQFTSTLSVNGASQMTDMNAYRGSVTDYIKRLTKEVPMSLIATTLWPGLKALEPTSQLGGIIANKRGYHNSRKNLPMPGYTFDYSIDEFSIDREGPNDQAAAIDWTFPNAQGGNYTTISKYSKRLYAARLDADNTRTKYIREFFGQIDSDSTVEGWDFSKDRATTSDSSHLWHIHISIHRKYVNDATAMKAILSILRGETLEQFKAGNNRDVVFQQFDATLPILKQGDSDPIVAAHDTAYVKRAQKQLQVTVDGDYGPATAAAVKALGFGNGGTINNDVWERLYAMWGSTVTKSRTEVGTHRSIGFEDFSAQLPILRFGDDDHENIDGSGTYYVSRAQRALNVADDGIYGNDTANAIKELMGAGTGRALDAPVYTKLYALWGMDVNASTTVKANRR